MDNIEDLLRTEADMNVKVTIDFTPDTMEFWGLIHDDAGEIVEASAGTLEEMLAALNELALEWLVDSEEG